jgi:glycosyltransferase involved in cell wall biosynthesis
MGTLADATGPEWDRLPRLSGLQPKVTAVVPARNEAADIERCLQSLIDQDYPELQICAVNDRSSDATGRIIDHIRQEESTNLRAIHISELPEGWLGKTHAMWRGAAETESEWILFTDGDIIYRSDALRRTLSYAELTGCDHLVILPTFIMRGFGEHMMLSFFGLMSSFIVRFWKARDPKARDFVGAGSFNLIRRSVYEELGTYRALRMEVIDDLKLGEAVKQHGFRQDCVLGRDLVSVRWAEGAFGVVRNLQKNMFGLLGFSWILAALVGIGTTIYHIGPWLGLFLAPGLSKVGFALGVGAIALLYARCPKQFGVSAWLMFTQPVAAVMFVYTLLNSALSALFHGGVVWRGTLYRMDEIQAGVATGQREREKLRGTRVNSSK